MDAVKQMDEGYGTHVQVRALPGDVQSWLARVLRPGESVAALLYADIAPSGVLG